jgi:hypothetical protein
VELPAAAPYAGREPESSARRTNSRRPVETNAPARAPKTCSGDAVARVARANRVVRP